MAHRFARSIRVTPAVAALLFACTIAASAKTAPHPIGERPVGAERIHWPAVPAAVKLAGGAVLVPHALAQYAALDEDRSVFEDNVLTLGDPAGDVPAGIRRVGSVTPSRRGGSVLRALSAGNVRINNTTGDASNTTNSETTIAALGNHLIAGWNDGLNFGISPGNTGWGYSTDGGATWTDGGVLPVASSSARHEGDPVVVNDFSGNFYFSDLFTPDGSTSAVAVCKGNFSGSGVTWTNPSIVASTTTDFLDKEWLAVDKSAGTVYCTYTRFLAAGGDQIEFSRSTDQGATWSAPIVLTNAATEDATGSRVAVGPGGVLQTVYLVYDDASTNNYIRGRRSTDGGLTWGPEITLPTGPSGIISNYGTGPAGFNRARGIGFPSLAFDNSGSTYNGRAYSTWEETVNFYNDPLGALGPQAEVEPNNSSAQATPITIGQVATGTLASTADQDWFSFTGTAGQTAVIYLLPNPTVDAYIRVFAGGGGAANRTQLSYLAQGVGLCVYTLPYTGTFYFRILANSATNVPGNYVVYTGWHVPVPGDEVGRDTRDAVLSYSDDGVTWSPRAVVNDDAALYDNAFPEVAVDQNGQVFVDWYDHRNDVLGIGTDIYYNASPNGGVAFGPSAQLNDGGSINWSLVNSNLAPNMGDYSALVADGCYVYANFADGRQTTPDSWLATISDCATPTELAFVSADVQPDHVTLTWYSATEAGQSAQVQRRAGGAEWATIGTIAANGTGMYVYRDAAVQAGASYDYRLQISGAGGNATYGQTSVHVPRTTSLAIQSVTNLRGTGFVVAYSLADTRPATLEVFDVSGRTIASARVNDTGSSRLGGSLTPGIYLVKLTQGTKSVVAKTALLR